jgi:hypothetical protein
MFTSSYPLGCKVPARPITMLPMVWSDIIYLGHIRILPRLLSSYIPKPSKNLDAFQDVAVCLHSKCISRIGGDNDFLVPE